MFHNNVKTTKYRIEQISSVRYFNILKYNLRFSLSVVAIVAQKNPKINYFGKTFDLDFKVFFYFTKLFPQLAFIFGKILSIHNASNFFYALLPLPKRVIEKSEVYIQKRLWSIYEQSDNFNILYLFYKDFILRDLFSLFFYSLHSYLIYLTKYAII